MRSVLFSFVNGIWLIIDGIALFFVSPSDLISGDESNIPKKDILI